MYPPDEDDITDEDTDDEEDGAKRKDVNHLGPGLLNQQAEIVIDDIYDELPDLQMVRLLLKIQ